MATYYATIDTSGISYQTSKIILFYRTCSFVINQGDYFNINELADGLQTDLVSYFASCSITTTVTVAINDPIIELSFTLTDADITNLPCNGELVGLQIIDTNELAFTYCFDTALPEPPTLCKTCQEVTISDCSNPLNIFIPGLNGLYDIRIENHQTGIVYTQNLEFDAGGETIWDTSVTPGLFNPFSVYTLTVLLDNEVVSWVDGSNEYNCMRLSFKTITDTTPS